MHDSLIFLAEPQRRWLDGVFQNVVFVVTADCQLSCRYCYLCGKNNQEVMTFEVARSAVDYVLTNPNIFREESVVWSFIGGEPFLEIDLIDRICDYVKMLSCKMDHPWAKNYLISLSSNGLLYDDPAVQNFIYKNKDRLRITISIDGTREKHDLHRIYSDGRGSYDDIMRRFALWREQFPTAHTKSTISHDDLLMVKDSVLHLWNMGINDVVMNCVFEDVWRDGDDAIFESQLVQLADFILKYRFYEKRRVSLFDRSIGFHVEATKIGNAYCGAGKMLAVNARGDFYPCFRFMPYSLKRKSCPPIGSIREGIGSNKLRPFLTLTRSTQSLRKCVECEVATGCAWCQGCNYDFAITDTIFQKANFMCKMHKARVRANNYLWNKLDKIIPPAKNDMRSRRLAQRKGLQSLIVVADSSAGSFCYYDNSGHRETETMLPETLRKVIYYALTNNLTLTVLAVNPLNEELKCLLNEVNHVVLHNVNSSEKSENSFDVFDFENDNWQNDFTGRILIIRIEKKNLPKLPKWLEKYSSAYPRISLIIKDLLQATEDDFTMYQEVLQIIADWLPEREEEKPLELSFLTDRLILTEQNHCDAGIKHVTIAPNGGFYLCPGFYYDGEVPFSDIDEVLRTHNLPIKNCQLLQLDHAPICEICDAFHCKRCVYLNRKSTLEVNTPSRQQCVFSHLERNVSRTLIEPLYLTNDVDIPKIDYLDPFEKLMKRDKSS